MARHRAHRRGGGVIPYPFYGRMIVTMIMSSIFYAFEENFNDHYNKHGIPHNPVGTHMSIHICY